MCGARPVNGEAGSGRDIGRRDVMDDLRLILDVVDAELDPVRDARDSMIVTPAASSAWSSRR